MIEKSVNKCNFFSDVLIITKWMKITEKQICEDQIVTFKQSHILLYQGLLFLTRSTCVIVDARSHTCKSHDFIPRYDINVENTPMRAYHYSDVIMGTIAYQITSLMTVFSAVYSDAGQRKHQSSASLAFLRWIHRWLVNSPQKWPVTRKMLPFDDVIMFTKQDQVNQRID